MWDAFRHTYAAARIGSALKEILEAYGLTPEESSDLAAALSEDLGGIREPGLVDILNDPNLTEEQKQAIINETKMDLVNNKVGADISKDLYSLE